MKELPVKIEYSIDTIAPSCANLARQEEPYLDLHEVSQRFTLTWQELHAGLRWDELNFEALEEELKTELMIELDNNGVPQKLWPNLDRYELRWKFGHSTDGWSSDECIEVWLQEKKS